MSYVMDAVITVISLAFLAVLGGIAGLALPGMFLVGLAPWLDKFLPLRKSGDPRR